MNNSDHKQFFRYLLPALRIFLGLVFLFSSVVKGIDPVGTSYRVEDYLQVYGWMALVPYSLEIAFLVIVSEFLIGLAFVTHVFVKTAAWGMFVMLLIFTAVTWFDARYNMVPDCGCFGDAVKLTNWQTFYKNVVLITLNAVFLWGRGKGVTKQKSRLTSWAILLVFGGGFLAFMFYNLNHLPVVDFRNWKTGRDMTMSPQPTQTFVVYRNKKTGEQKEFLFPDYPWKDSAWMAQWTFVSQRSVTPAVEKKYNLVMEDSLGVDHTKALVENPGFQLLLVSYNLQKAAPSGFRKMVALSAFLEKKHVQAALVTATPAGEAVKTEKGYGLRWPVYLADETDLKAMIRSNPGLILLHHGVILKKWHYHDFPDTTQLKRFLSSP